MARHRRQLSCHSAVNVLDDVEVRREEDVEVALVNLQTRISLVMIMLGGRM
jgi:hypothetical protein